MREHVRDHQVLAAMACGILDEGDTCSDALSDALRTIEHECNARGRPMVLHRIWVYYALNLRTQGLAHYEFPELLIACETSGLKYLHRFTYLAAGSLDVYEAILRIADAIHIGAFYKDGK
jgi:hypothetical protein